MKKVYTVKEKVIVKNVNGTSENTCPNCATWIGHWGKLSGDITLICSISGYRVVRNLPRLAPI